MKSTIRQTDWLLVVGAALLIGLPGCSGSGGDYEVARVQGKITYQGQAVEGGSITFRPVNVANAKLGMMGKPASAEVQEDGTFVLSTYGEEDGAVVGEHEVLYTPVYVGAESYDDKPKPSPYAGLGPKMRNVNVQSGHNTIEIELVASASRR